MADNEYIPEPEMDDAPVATLERPTPEPARVTAAVAAGQALLPSLIGLAYEPGMLEYHRDVDLSILVDHPKLREPPTAARSRWREQMSREQLERFEAIAGDLLAELGYERAVPSPSRRAQTLAGAERAALSARVASWHAALTVVRRSPVWRLRQVYVRRTAHPASPR